MAKSGVQRRKAQNQGVKGGTVRTGAKGKFVRKYNDKTGRWEKVQSTAGTGYGKSTPSYLSTRQAPKSDKKTSGATGTYTKSYERPVTPKASKAPEGPKASSKRSVVFGGAGSRSIKGKRAVTTNRPERGKTMQLVTERDGTRRWITYVAPKKGKK